MLEAILQGGRQPIACDDYVITQAWNGQDGIRFELSRRNPVAMVLTERMRIYETTGGQTYLVDRIDAGQTRVAYELRKDLSDWERKVYPGYTNSTRSATAEATIRGVLPVGWTLTCQETDSLAAYIELQGPTALEVVEHCGEVYGCAVTFDTEKKRATLRFPARQTLGGAFLVETANLRAAPEYKSKATNLVTRLYAQGAEGMDFSAVNNGKNYVECFDYTDEVVAGFWRDDRYTVPEHLLQAAREKIQILAQPERSWSLEVADLHAVEGTAWPGLQLALYDVVKLIDPSLGQQMEAQITEVRLYPHHPERNEISVETRGSTIRSLTAAALLMQKKEGLYQDLVITVDQVKQDLTDTNDTVEAVTAAAALAQSTADSAKSAAGTAQSTADSAKSAAATAQSTADSAKSAAATAQSTADSAKSAAATAQSTANAAQSTAQSIANGSYSGGSFISGTTIKSPSVTGGMTVQSGLTLSGNLTIGGVKLTDFVVEQGKSGSWYYRKWNSGYAELWGNLTFKVTGSTGAGSLYYSDNVTLDLPFSVSNGTLTGIADSICFVCGGGVNGDSVNFYLVRPLALSSTANYTAKLMVQGRWK